MNIKKGEAIMWRSLASVIVVVLLAACASTGDIENLQDQLKGLKATISEQEGPSSSQPLNANGNRKPAKNLLLKIKAKFDLFLAPIFSPIDIPAGKFVLQVSTSFNDVTGVMDGQTTGFLQTLRPGAANEILLIGARYSAAIDGLTAVVEDGGIFGGASHGAPVSFPSVHELDLQIEQTATQLIFSARPTTRPASGAWTVIYTLDNAPNAQGATPAIGISKISHKGQLGFDNFCVDAEHIGGAAEESVIHQLRAGEAALVQAQQNLTATIPDISAAAAHIATALGKLDGAIGAVNAGLMAGSFQSTTSGDKALKALKKANKALLKIQAKMTALAPAQAHGQSQKLGPVLTNMLSATFNLLGFKYGAGKFTKPLNIITFECAISS